MKWRLAITLALLLMTDRPGAPAQFSPLSPAGTEVAGTRLQNVATPLREAWLRFHESDLCLSVDSVFVFQPKSMEIWGRVKDEKSYQALAAMMEPLQKAYRVDIYAARPEREKKPWSPDDDDPLPSLWTNSELRIYFRDPFSNRIGAADESPDRQVAGSPIDPQLRRRMKLYGDQILEWTKKMERLAADLPALADAAYGADSAPDTRQRARAVCLDHVKEVGKYADRLGEELAHALPRGTGDPRPASPAAQPAPPSMSPEQNAREVSVQSRDISRRITRFLYPQAHTVGLTDLREPGLLDSLKSLQESAAEFERNARKTR